MNQEMREGLSGCRLFQRDQERVRDPAIIAEDLGVITPEVRALRDQFELPGTRILQFAFDGRPDNPYLPANYFIRCGG
jgi:4-alpha-glucanotransferase